MSRRLPSCLYLLVLFCLTIPAQQVTYSPQGSAALKQLTGKVIRSFQLVGITVCSAQDQPLLLPGGRVYEGATLAGFDWLEKDAAASVLIGTANTNWKNLAVDFAGDAALVGTIFIGSGLITASARAWVSLITGHALADMVGKRAQTFAPNPTPVLQKLISSDQQISLSPSSCMSGYIGAQFSKKQPGLPNQIIPVKEMSEFYCQGCDFRMAYKIRAYHLSALQSVNRGLP